MLCIGNEIGDVVPSFANFDAASTVVTKRTVPFIVASLHHGIPHVKKSMLRHPMRFLALRMEFSPEAPARFTRTPNKASFKHCAFLAAIATANIFSLAAFAGSIIAQYGPSTKFSSNHFSLHGKQQR